MIPDPFLDRVVGPYRVVAQLGAGGMSMVYRAVHTRLNRPVAVKVLRRELVDGGEAADRFRREAQAVARLRHPHVIHVLDFDMVDGQPYLVMELMEGGSVRDWAAAATARDERPALAEVLRIALDALDGLGHAHAAGIIHRDLKPSNILLTDRGRAVLSDFGIARVAGDAAHTATGEMLGTLAYMAPEQGLRGEVGIASDLYAIGIILFELTTGRVPFEGDTPLGTLMKHVQEPLPDPRSLNSDLPPPIADVIAWALAKAPTDRPTDAAALAEALRAAALQCGLALPEHVDLPERDLPAVISGEARHGFPGLARQDAATETPLAQGVGRAQPSRTGPAVFAGLATLFLANLLSIGFAGMLGSFPAIISRLWPFEILWLAFFLSLIAWARRGTGMLTPIGITLAVGLPSLYYGLSGDWQAWWWWVFAVAATPTAILSGYALARRNPPRSVARLNAGLVVLTGALCAAAIIGAFLAVR